MVPERKAAAWTLAAMLLGAAACAGAHELDADVGGTAFSPLESAVPMPEAWRRQAVTHAADVAADLVVTLDQQLYPALLPRIEDWARARGLEVRVANGTCGISSGRLAHKRVDVGGYCCPPGAADRLPGLRFHTVGIAAVALITHPDNPIDDVGLATARALFHGNLQRWSDPALGDGAGSPRLVEPVARLHCKRRPGHWRLLLDGEELFSPHIREVGAIPDMIAEVAGNGAAIGYETLWMVHHNREHGRVKVLTVDGVHPGDAGALAAGRYPLYRTYNLTTWSDPEISPETSRELVAALLAEAPSLPEKYGIVPHQALRAAGWRFDGDELIGAPAEEEANAP